MTEANPTLALRERPERKVSPPLLIGILFVPGIFVWFLLRRGHSPLSRTLGFGWATLLLLLSLSVVSVNNALPDARGSKTPTLAKTEHTKDETVPDSETIEASTDEPEIAELEEAPAALPPQPTTSDEQRRGMHCLNNWDGSHWDMQSAIKRRLRNPDSFDHVETRITPIDEAGNHSIFMTYRAQNGFGGLNVQQAIGVVDNAECELVMLQM